VDDNDATLQSYNDHIQEYVDGTPKTVEGDFKAWIDQALDLIPQGSSMLELGSGFGRDADYIESKGFKVNRTDAAQGFVDLMAQQGHHAQLLNVITDEFGENLDMIFANAVLLHLSPGQTEKVIAKAYKSLKPGGVFAFSVKQGEGSGWSQEKLNAKRYYKYWTESELKSQLVRANFKQIDLSNSTDKWLQVIAKK
jgi:predicted TPR repeat methyltransferase